MEISYKDGAIVASAKQWESAKYDVGNLLLNAQFDGRGSISRYAVINKFEVLDSLWLLFSVDDKSMDFSEDKTVEMIGRTMNIKTEFKGVDINIRQFLTKKDNAVFTRITLLSESDCVFEATANLGLNFTSYIEELVKSRLSLKTVLKAGGGFLAKRLTKKHKKVFEKSIKNDLLGDFYIDYASNLPITPLEENSFFINQFKVTATLKAGETSTIDIVMSSGTRKDFSACDVNAMIQKADEAEQEALEYTKWLKRYDKSLTEKEKAFYVSCLNCALSNYKERGDFKGFLAGLVYQFPARTYYRDGYWTCLPVLKACPELIRNQLLTLAGGISKEGKCPSAVKWNFKNWWGDHYDSPSFFVMLLYDYISHTGDEAILSAGNRRGIPIISLARLVMSRLKNQTDDTGMLLKSGDYNRRDWADNVFRTGYVTYDIALYARALYCMSKLEKIHKNPELTKAYMSEFEKVKAAINEQLWSQDLGYFINYKDTARGVVEDNLSIDTCVLVLFDLTTEERKASVLQKMESMLESKNNSEQVLGDFGVFSAYPFYKRNDAVVLKSSYPYYYHNGGDWPYLSAAYACAKATMGMDYKYPLMRWFEYNIEKKNFTPVEFFSPAHADGSLMQGWSAMGAFTLDEAGNKFFK